MAVSEPMQPSGARRTRALLAAGALLGLGLAVGGLLRGGREAPSLPHGAVATVNGEVVRTEEFERALAALASDRREPLDEDDRRHILDRLLDEELLVQHGLELGLARHDRRVRSDIVSALIQAVVSEADEREPSRAEIESFYDEHRDYFTEPGRLHVRQIFVRAGSLRDAEAARVRAEEAAVRARNGEGFEAVARALGDEPLPPIPDGPLPASKLREYLGPTATRTALALETGAVSEPVRSGSGFHVLQVVAREERRLPPLAEIEEQVRAEWRRRAGDEALRQYLRELRQRATLRVAEPLP